MSFLLKEHYIKENSEIFDFEFTKKEMDKVIKSIGESKKILSIIYEGTRKILKI